jgi:hypothetical protein
MSRRFFVEGVAFPNAGLTAAPVMDLTKYMSIDVRLCQFAHYVLGKTHAVHDDLSWDIFASDIGGVLAEVQMVHDTRTDKSRIDSFVHTHLTYWNKSAGSVHALRTKITDFITHTVCELTRPAFMCKCNHIFYRHTVVATQTHTGPQLIREHSFLADRLLALIFEFIQYDISFSPAATSDTYSAVPYGEVCMLLVSTQHARCLPEFVTYFYRTWTDQVLPSIAGPENNVSYIAFLVRMLLLSIVEDRVFIREV